MEGDGQPCYTSGPIHHVVHKLVPLARCLVHLHPTNVTALGESYVNGHVQEAEAHYGP